MFRRINNKSFISQYWFCDIYFVVKDIGFVSYVYRNTLDVEADNIADIKNWKVIQSSYQNGSLRTGGMQIKLNVFPCHLTV